MNLKTKISYTLYILLALVLFTSCDESTVNIKSTGLVFKGRGVDIIVIDSCEYIYIPNGNASWGAHKGNCKFCLGRNR